MTKYSAEDLVLEHGNGAGSEVFTQVAQVLAMGLFGSSRGLIDASAYGDDWKDWLVGQQDGDEVTITLELDPADSGHIALKADYDAATRRNFQLRHDDSELLVGFPALITSFKRGGDRDGLLQAEMTVKILNPGVQDVDLS